MEGTGGAGGGGIIQRYKFGWRFLCISNLALGAYIFSRTPKKEKTVAENKNETKDPAEPVVEKSTPPKEAIVGSPPIPKSVIERQPVIVHEHRAEREPISAYQQREVFKWMLEEKMKTKPNNREEKERIDEEKALLEQYIHTLGFSAHMFEPKIDKTAVVASKVETKSLTEGEPVTKHKPLIKGEPVTKHKPMIDGEPMTEHEPFIRHESLTQHKAVMQHESVIQREPMTEDEPVTERDLVKERGLVTESEPVIQHKSVMEHEPVIERGPVTEHELMPAYQQQELFKWMLEEMMKTKPSNQEEEERINEEKALLENYIRALSFSSHMFIPKKEKTVVMSKVETKAPHEDTKFSLSNSKHDMEQELIPAYQQKELFKWLLEEKRKIKPKNPEEEEKINQEKALLEHFIRSNSVPSI